MTCGPAESAELIGIVATTLLVAGSMRVTEPLCSLATHTASSVTTTPSGCIPTGIFARTLPLAGSIRRTAPFS